MQKTSRAGATGKTDTCKSQDGNGNISHQEKQLLTRVLNRDELKT